MILRQRQSATAYASEFMMLAHKPEWDESALTSHFYEGLQDRVKDAVIAVSRPDSLQGMIDTAVKIDERQYERDIDKRAEDTSRPNAKQIATKQNTSKVTIETKNKLIS